MTTTKKKKKKKGVLNCGVLMSENVAQEEWR